MITGICPRCGQPGRLYTFPNSGTPPMQDCHHCRARFAALARHRAKTLARRLARQTRQPE